jgi:predicted RNase H-like nuclease (RuvC/YqgF family)
MTQSEVLTKFYKELEPMRTELSQLRSGLATFKSAHEAQKRRADKLEKENRRLQAESLAQKKEIDLLKEKLTNQKNISGTYAGIAPAVQIPTFPLIIS